MDKSFDVLVACHLMNKMIRVYESLDETYVSYE